MIEISKQEMEKISKALLALLVVIAVFFVFKIASVAKEYRYIGGGVSASNVISVSGSGEVFAIPDTATISFTVRNEGADVKIAQDLTTAKVDEVLATIKDLGIEDKDVKTTSYVSNPKYTYEKTTFYYPVQGKITGYEVAQTIEVKVRDTAKTGEVLGALGTAGVTETYGPNYTVDDEESLIAEARQMAIDEAKAKAEELANQLGVRLVRIVSFNEGQYSPFAESKGVSYDSMTGAMNPTPQIPVGESKITSDVYISYEIR